MSSESSLSTAVTPSALWRSAAQRARLAAGTERADEFPPGAAAWPAMLDRREFLQGLTAAIALAGLSGCSRVADKIVPRVVPPELSAAPGQLLTFASAMSFDGYARGILVTSHEGRPTKIEGNPDHPESLGATDVFTQAAILSLYDPDRSSQPLRSGQPATWAEFEDDWTRRRSALVGRRGAGLTLLTEPTTSPTLRREIHRVLDAFPAARWFQHDPLAGPGGEQQTDCDFAAADVILAIQSDCFYRHPAAVRYGRALASRRRIESGQARPPRFYAMEATPTVTGALADFRLPVSPARIRLVLDAVARSLAGLAPTDASALSPAEREFVRAFTVDVRAHTGTVAVVAGAECDAAVHRWVAALNARAGRQVVRPAVAVRSDDDPRASGNLDALAAAIGRGEVRELFVFGANPAYTGAADLDFAEKFSQVEFTVHSGEYADETAALARWHLPAPHFLETWSDLRAFSGPASIQQPLIEPLHASRSALELLRLLSHPPGAEAYAIVRETWQGDLAAEEFASRWHRWLTTGVIEGSAPSPVDPNGHEVPAFPTLTLPAGPEALTIVFQPDANLLDGRWSNNAWLQELPRPLTKLVWDNAALISHALADARHLSNGDVVLCEIDGRRCEAPVWVMPGQAADVVTLMLGYGRTHAGTVGNKIGYNAYPLRTTAAAWQARGTLARVPGRHLELVSTQEHFSLAGRDLVRVVAPADAARPPENSPAAPSLYPAWNRDRYAWGLTIDLATCLGCNACVLACQAENNIPTVGKDQVARGREMHWIRLDRYHSGEPANPRFLHQPVPCMQCEDAPCEVVCPVAATVHSSEGLNDMVYNRCVGTRYCSNNCPYKVRRFNFLDYRAAPGAPVYLQSNPQVTVRERGVMEKCTYCVQRINTARIAADRENRPIRDGEIQTACQQACPAEAIVFGNVNDPASRVSRRKAEPTNYALLGELNTRPRTTYLAVLRHHA